MGDTVQPQPEVLRMPWRITAVEDERIRFIKLYCDRVGTMRELCRAFGISRKTGYKYVARYAADGVRGLQDRSRARRSSSATPESVRRLLIAARQRYPTWGAEKLVAWLATQHPGARWPAPSTASALLRAAGLVRPRRLRHRVVPWSCGGSAVPPTPNDLWTADFKGWFRAQNGERCDPLTIIDATSRFLLACDLVAGLTHAEAAQVFERILREYGLPRAIRTDNGEPFASTALGGLTRLSLQWLKLGIGIERTVPGNPGGNARHERLHLTLQQDVAATPSATRAAQQLACDRWRRLYNEERPHAALGNRPPAACYTPSPRPYPARLRPPTYDVDVAVRLVRPDGHIKWHGRKVFLSRALAGEAVGLRPLATDGHWMLEYGPMELGIVNEVKRRVIRFRTIRARPVHAPEPQP